MFDPLDTLGRHELAADVAFRDEGVIVVDLGQLRFKLGTQRLGVAAVNDGLQIVDHTVALDDFKAVSDFVNAVVDGLKLGRFVDHVFRRRHLAAIVQPSRDVQFVPLLVGQFEVAERTVLLFARSRR